MRALIALLLAFAGISHASVTVLPGGDNQTARIGGTFPSPIRFAVKDTAGNAVPGAAVLIQATGGRPVVCCLLPDLFVFSVSALSDSDGIATLPILTGDAAGTTQFRVRAFSEPYTEHGETTLTVNVSNKPPPARIDNLKAPEPLPAGQTKVDAFRVQVLDTTGAPVEYAVVGFEYARGDLPSGTYAAAGVFDAPLRSRAAPINPPVVADAQGIATATFTPALAKGTPNDAAAGKTGGGVVEASLRWDVQRLRIPYVVAPAATAPATLQDLWWSGMSENGWGLSVIEHPGNTDFDLPKLFVVLFIYDAQGNPVWYVMPSGQWSSGYGSNWIAEVYKAHGPPFHAYDARLHGIGEPIGTLELKFVGSHGIDMSFGLWYANLETGETLKRLTRLDFSGIPPSPRQRVDDLWWGGPAQNGWGISIHENPGAIFSVWFTYGDDGAPLWFAMSDGSWIDSNTFAGPIFKPFGAKWIGVPYDAAQHHADAVGSFTLRFGAGTPPGRATFDYSVDARRGVLDLSRVPF